MNVKVWDTHTTESPREYENAENVTVHEDLIEIETADEQHITHFDPFKIEIKDK